MQPIRKQPVQKRNRYAYSKEKPSPGLSAVAESPLRIGSFILQTLGRDPPRSTLQDTNTDVSGILADILKRYDLLLLMEARTSTETNIDRLIRILNTVDRINPFDFEESESMCQIHGVREHYCFFYRVSKLSVLDVHHYGGDPFKQGGWGKLRPKPSLRADRSASDHRKKKPFPRQDQTRASYPLVTTPSSDLYQADAANARGFPLRSLSDSGQQSQSAPAANASTQSPSLPDRTIATLMKEASCIPSLESPSNSAGSIKSPLRYRGSDVEFVGQCVVGTEVSGPLSASEEAKVSASEESPAAVPEIAPSPPQAQKRPLICARQPRKMSADDWEEHTVTLKKSCSSTNLLDQLALQVIMQPDLSGLNEVSHDSFGSTTDFGQVMSNRGFEDQGLLASTAHEECVYQFPEVPQISTPCASTAAQQDRNDYTDSPPQPSTSMPGKTGLHDGGNSEVIWATLDGPVPMIEDSDSSSEMPKEVFVEPVVFSFSRVPFAGSSEGTSSKKIEPYVMRTYNPFQVKEQQQTSLEKLGMTAEDVPTRNTALEYSETFISLEDNVNTIMDRNASEDNDIAGSAPSSVTETAADSDDVCGNRGQDRNQQNNPDPEDTENSSDIDSEFESDSELSSSDVDSELNRELKAFTAKKKAKEEESLQRSVSSSDSSKSSVRFSRRASVKFTPNRFQSLSIAETNYNQPRKLPLPLCCCCGRGSSSNLFQKEFEVKIKEDTNSSVSSDGNNTKSDKNGNRNKSKGKNQNACFRDGCSYQPETEQKESRTTNFTFKSGNVDHRNICNHDDQTREEIFSDYLTGTKSDTDLQVFKDSLDPKCLQRTCWSSKGDSQMGYHHEWRKRHLKQHPDFSEQVLDFSAFDKQHQACNNKETMHAKTSSDTAKRNRLFRGSGQSKSLSTDIAQQHTNSLQQFTGDASEKARVFRMTQSQNKEVPKQVTDIKNTRKSVEHFRPERFFVEIGCSHFSSMPKDTTNEKAGSEGGYQSAPVKETLTCASDTSSALKQGDLCVPHADQPKRETSICLKTHHIPKTDRVTDPQEPVNNDNTTPRHSKIDRSENKISLTPDTVKKHKHHTLVKTKPSEKQGTFRKREVELVDIQDKHPEETQPSAFQETATTSATQRHTSPEIKITPNRKMKMDASVNTTNLSSCVGQLDPGSESHKEQLFTETRASLRDNNGGSGSETSPQQGQTQWNVNSNADEKGKRRPVRMKKLPAANSDLNPLAKVFCLEPFAVLFLSSSTEVMRFAAMAIHTDPSDAAKEALAIQRLYDLTANKWHIEDILIVGDFVMVDSARGMPNWKGVEVKSDRRFCFRCPSFSCTSLPSRERNCDRMVVAGIGLNRSFIPSGVGYYRYDRVLGLHMTPEVRTQMGDHYPIEIQISGMAKTRWNKHVRPSVGVVIQQVQNPPVASALGFRAVATPSAATAGFLLELLVDGASKKRKEIRATRKNVSDVVSALKEFQVAFPDVLKDPTLAVAASFVVSPCLTASPFYGFRFGSQTPTFDLEVTLSQQAPHVLRLGIQRHLYDGFRSHEDGLPVSEG